MKATEEILPIESPDVAPAETPPEEQNTDGLVVPPTTREMGLGLRYRMAFLSLLYRYLVCLFWIGVITALAMMGLLFWVAFRKRPPSPGSNTSGP